MAETTASKFFGGAEIDPPASREHTSTATDVSDTAGYIPCEISSGEIDTILYPTSNSATLRGYLGGTLIWTVAYTDIDGSAFEWGSMFYADLANKVAWVNSVRASEETQIATVDLTDGSITTVGSLSGVPSVSDLFDAESAQYTWRASESSGDFTVYSRRGYYTVNETTGAITGETDTTFGHLIPNYVTLDKQFMLSGGLYIVRMSNLTTQKMATTVTGYPGSSFYAASLGCVNIGDDRAYSASPFTTAIPYTSQGRCLSFSDLDRFVMEIGENILP